MLPSYGKGLSTLRLTINLEDYLNILAGTSDIWGRSPPSATPRRAMPWSQRPYVSWTIEGHKYVLCFWIPAHIFVLKHRWSLSPLLESVTRRVNKD
jgi:hypothetical protein